MSRICLAVLLMSSATLLFAADEPICRKAEISDPPSWLFSGAWGPDGLILVDTINRTLPVYPVTQGRMSELRGVDKVVWSISPESGDRGGDRWAQGIRKLGNEYSFLRPTTVRTGPPGSDRIYVATEPGISDEDRLLWGLTEHLKPVTDERFVLNDISSEYGTLKAVWDFVPLGDQIGDQKIFLTFGDVEGSGGKWTTGFHLTRLGKDKSSFEPIEKATLSSNSYKGYYLVGNSVACRSASGKGVALVMGKTAKLVVVDPDSDNEPQVVNLADRIGFAEAEVPEADWVHDRSTATLYARITDLRSIVGVYCDPELDGAFVLSRSPASTSGEEVELQRTDWQLRHIDFEEETASAPINLPIHSAHLLVAPGETWAFIEKGPVIGFGEQPIGDTWLVAGQAIRNLVRDRLVDAAEVFGHCE